MTDTTHTLDINATFRGGGRSIEWLDEINKACIVMLPPRGLPSGRAETGIVPKDVAKRSLRELSGAIATA